MRFLVDECTGPVVAEWLRRQDHDVVSVFDEIRGADDRDVIHKAYEQNRILITNDKDFGELVFRDKKPHMKKQSSGNLSLLQKLLSE